jgi:hypothetical protein
VSPTRNSLKIPPPKFELSWATVELVVEVKRCPDVP